MRTGEPGGNEPIMLGGIIEANVPAEAIQPTEKDLSYLSRFISGRAILPKIAVVAMEDPDTAPNKAQLKQVAIPRDPGTPLLNTLTPLYARLANPQFRDEAV